MLGPMLQALLEYRFQLRIHRENKEMPAYALVVAKGGPKLKPTEPGSCTPVDDTQGPRPPLAPGQPPRCGGASAGRDGLLKAYGLTMANLCPILTTQVGRKVVFQDDLQKVGLRLESFKDATVFRDRPHRAAVGALNFVALSSPRVCEAAHETELLNNQ